jgi:DNA-binding Xre family transcriptional regulator
MSLGQHVTYAQMAWLPSPVCGRHPRVRFQQPLRWVGVRAATVSALENGRVGRVEGWILESLTVALGVEPGFLIVRDPESQPKRKGRRRSRQLLAEVGIGCLNQVFI